jgi:hypothetical protein
MGKFKINHVYKNNANMTTTTSATRIQINSWQLPRTDVTIIPLYARKCQAQMEVT